MSTTAFEHLLVESEGTTAIVTLNRPKVLNALNAALLSELSVALLELERNASIRAIVLTGSGEKAFAAGADIGELSALRGAREGSAKARTGQGVTRLMERCSKPVIVAVNGYALGGGCELAMGGDIRIASENARFGQPEVNLGIIPGYGGSQRTMRLLGAGMAMYLCLTGETIDAHQALQCGLVQKVVPAAELMTEAKRIAGVIATRAPLAIAAAKRAMNGAAHLALDDALEIEALEFGALIESDDFREGTAAFLEKRKPAWSGH